MNPRIKPNQPQDPSPRSSAGVSPAELLAKVPRRPMSAEQQAAALQKVQRIQQQATERVKLGQQLFDAAESRLKQHQGVLKEIQDQQQRLREQVQEDVAKSLQSYDQWMGRIDESFTNAIKELNQRIDLLETRIDCSHGDMERMIGKAGALLEQTQGLLAEAFGEEAVDPELLRAVMGGGASTGETMGPEPVYHTAEPSTSQPASADDFLAEQDEAEDVFGEVLRRLRSQNDAGGHAAA